MRVWSHPALGAVYLPAVDDGPPRLLGAWLVETDDGRLWAVANVLGGWRKPFAWNGPPGADYLELPESMARLVAGLLGICELPDRDALMRAGYGWTARQLIEYRADPLALSRRLAS